MLATNYISFDIYLKLKVSEQFGATQFLVFEELIQTSLLENRDQCEPLYTEMGLLIVVVIK